MHSSQHPSASVVTRDGEIVKEGGRHITSPPHAMDNMFGAVPYELSKRYWLEQEARRLRKSDADLKVSRPCARRECGC